MLNYPSAKSTSLPADIKKLAEKLSVLAEPNRLLIFNLLMEGTRCNCELGDLLDMPRNLISHHLSKLRAAGLVNVERDAVDARWVYYSVNRAAIQELSAGLGTFFDPDRIKNVRHPGCGPQNLVIAAEDLEVRK